MSATIHDDGMLKTPMPERGLFVLTCLPGHASAPHLAWTAIMAETGPRVLWLDMHSRHGRRVTPGGLAELHRKTPRGLRALARRGMGSP